MEKSLTLSIVWFFVVLFFPLSVAGNPNHLEPIAPYDQYGLKSYGDLVFRTLITDARPQIWMICKPSFRPEYSILLRKIILEDSGSNYYELEFAKPKFQIWHWEEDDDSSITLNPLGNVEIERQTAQISADIAQSLIQAWTCIIKGTRYAEEVSVGFDGVTYDFFASPNLFGQTWSPSSGTPKMMVDCGELLTRYVTSAASEQKNVIEKIQLTVGEIIQSCSKRR